MPAAAGIDAFERMVKKYYEDHVQQPEGPKTAFLRDSNAGNWVYGAATSRPPFPGHKQLVTCLDLTGLHEVFLAARDTYRMPYFCDLTDSYPANANQTSDAVYEWHETRMPRGDAGRVREHIRQLLGALAQHIAQKNFHHPIWATFWEDYRPLAASSHANTWLALVGVAKCFWPRRWLALMRYQVDEVGTLVRPTVLDAGWYAIHFPSPPQAHNTAGGHPVNLVSKPNPPLLCEFIHVQIKFTVQHWEATKTPGWESTGGMVAATGDMAEPLDMIHETRQAHYELLASADNYGPEVKIWMPDPN